MRDIGKKLKTLRKAKKLTQQDVSDRIGLSRATLSNYEVGRRTPHLSLLRRFCDLYGVELSYFEINTQDEVFELLGRARDVFDNAEISKEDKERIYKEVMRMYLDL